MKYNSQFHYPHVIEFVDSLTNVFLILFIPSMILLSAYIFRVIFVMSRRDNAYVNSVYYISLALFFSLYAYYAFFILNYFSLLGDALLSLIRVLLYVIFSPFIFLYLILTVSDVEKSLFLNSETIIRDMLLWLKIKFALDISDMTKESLLVAFKLLTLALFSTKIINVTRFIISSVTSTYSKRDTYMAVVLYVFIFILYIFINVSELTKLFDLMVHIGSTMLDGALK